MTLSMGPTAGDRSLVGFRFVLPTNIVRNTNILSAVLQWHMNGQGSAETFPTRVVCEAIDNAPNFVTNADVALRAKTVQQVVAEFPWPPPLDLWYSTPNFAPVLQEVIDRSGWAAGNAVVVILWGNISTTTQDGTVDPYELGPGTNPARLVLSWGYQRSKIPLA